MSVSCAERNASYSAAIPVRSSEAKSLTQLEDEPAELASWSEIGRQDGSHALSPRNALLIEFRADTSAAAEIHLSDLRFSPLRPRTGMVQVVLDQALLKEAASSMQHAALDPLDALDVWYGRPVVDVVMRDLALSAVPTLDQSDGCAELFRLHVARALSVHLLGKYTECQGEGTFNRGGLAPWQLRRVRERVQAQPTPFPTPDSLACECGLSSGHFARAFRNSTGISPRTWLMRQRLERAKQLLRRSKLSLADISLACGFSDQSHFTRLFTREERISPGRWRKMQDPRLCKAERESLSASQ